MLLFGGEDGVGSVAALKVEGLDLGQACREYLDLMHAGSRFGGGPVQRCLQAFESGLVVPSFLDSGVGTDVPLKLFTNFSD